MSEEDIEYLKQIVNQNPCLAAYFVSDGYYRRIIRVGPNEREQEPGDCGFFEDGTYIALYNTDLDDLWIGLAQSLGVWPSRNKAK